MNIITGHATHLRSLMSSYFGEVPMPVVWGRDYSAIELLKRTEAQLIGMEPGK